MATTSIKNYCYSAKFVGVLWKCNRSGFLRQYIQCESKKVALKTLCDIFTCGEPMYLKIVSVIAQTYSYVCGSLGPFIW